MSDWSKEKTENFIDDFCKKLAQEMLNTIESIPIYSFIDRLGSYCSNGDIEGKLESIDCELDLIKEELSEVVEVLKTISNDLARI